MLYYYTRLLCSFSIILGAPHSYCRSKQTDRRGTKQNERRGTKQNARLGTTQNEQRRITQNERRGTEWRNPYADLPPPQPVTQIHSYFEIE